MSSCPQSPGRPQRSKRRCLSAAVGGRGFVPASSLRALHLGPWLEAPRPPASCSSSSSSSSSYLTPVSEEEVEEGASPGGHSPVCLSRRLKQRLTAAASTAAESLSFLTEEEKRWLDGEQGDAPTGTEEIVISDEEDEAVVRSAQEDEDEAFARSLQAQFDQEETHRHQHLHHHHLLHHQLSHHRALLAFEDRQGPVVSRKLTRGQIQRFPTKTFQAGAGNT
ncbi:hypothetical protein FQN60_004476, partial [Etheostoma spectabile]